MEFNYRRTLLYDATLHFTTIGTYDTLQLYPMLRSYDTLFALTTYCQRYINRNTCYKWMKMKTKVHETSFVYPFLNSSLFYWLFLSLLHLFPFILKSIMAILQWFVRCFRLFFQPSYILLLYVIIFIYVYFEGTSM